MDRRQGLMGGHLLWFQHVGCCRGMISVTSPALCSSSLRCMAAACFCRSGGGATWVVVVVPHLRA
jgi:hypothetical protein